MEEKFYLTKKGLDRIQKEYQNLLDFKAGKIKDEAPTMWHSEEVNPEYLLYQEDMSSLDSKLAELEAILKNAEVIAPPPKDKRHTVHLGATVTLEEESTNVINEYMLLGTLEASPMEGKISSASPVGRELLGKQVGETIVISSPIKVVYRVKRITYLLK